MAIDGLPRDRSRPVIKSRGQRLDQKKPHTSPKGPDRRCCRLKPTKTLESGHFLVRWLSPIAAQTQSLDAFTPGECANYFKNAGYGLT